MTLPGHHGHPETQVSTLIDELLAEQRQLTAVEKFSRQHEHSAAPALQAHYRDLIPLTAPRPGEQYAFEVDLDRCSGCKGCVTACHSLNGLDEDESWREVGFLVGETVVPLTAAQAGKAPAPADRQFDARTFGNRVIPLQQTVTTACHHCVEPACLLGCPVLAYDKDPVTGIVRHLDDQCIGCSYCILKCPYEVPKYSAQRGIVRKCDLCHGRLAEGEAPACVQACPNEAIRIAWVKPAALAARYRPAAATHPDAYSNPWLPDSPDPALTLPTTRYHTRQPNLKLRAADHDRLTPQPAHWPLVAMLLLTQFGVGLFLFTALTQGRLLPSVRTHLLLAAWLGLHAGLGASVFHLGQPLRAWRAYLGWRTSWMSREIITFGVLSGLATGAVAANLEAPFGHWLPAFHPFLSALLVSLTAAAGGLAVFTSAMIYVDTQRPCWRAPDTFIRFFGQTLLLGSAGAACLVGWAHWLRGEPPGIAVGLASAALVVRTALFIWERGLRRRAAADAQHPAHRSTRLAQTHFRGTLQTRLALFGLSTAAGLLALADFANLGPVWATVSFLSTATSSVLKRRLFFTTALAPKMPGMP
jgi:Fe-S-cluster-containing dehydrogenase component/DMSO reductase anchor subunit